MNQIRRIYAVAIKEPVKQSFVASAMKRCLEAYTDHCQKSKVLRLSEAKNSRALTIDEQLDVMCGKRPELTDKAKLNATIAKACILYRLAMPPLDSFQEIHAYIACVAQGVAFGIFSGRDGSQLLYAAQVALTVVQLRQKDEAIPCQPKRMQLPA